MSSKGIIIGLGSLDGLAAQGLMSTPDAWASEISTVADAASDNRQQRTASAVCYHSGDSLDRILRPHAVAGMKTTQTKTLVSKCFIFSLLLSATFFLLFSLQSHHQTTAKQPPKQPNSEDADLRIRPGYSSYEAYIQRQLNKTLNPKLRRVWTTRDWDRKIQVFANFFAELKQKHLLSNDSKALCIGARVGQEVEALRRVGVSDSVGIDLVPYPPLVLRGDFHHQPFDNETFDFEFSNVFDHALYPNKFVEEIERTLKPGGICVLNVALSRRSDKYSANDLYSIRPLKALFHRSDFVHARNVDGFGLDTEVVFQKKKVNQPS